MATMRSESSSGSGSRLHQGHEPPTSRTCGSRSTIRTRARRPGILSLSVIRRRVVSTPPHMPLAGRVGRFQQTRGHPGPPCMKSIVSSSPRCGSAPVRRRVYPDAAGVRLSAPRRRERPLLQTNPAGVSQRLFQAPRTSRGKPRPDDRERPAANRLGLLLLNRT
jgi:hypothetical protein